MKFGEMVALREDVERVQLELWKALPTGVPIIAIILALAEMQKEVALLFFREDEEDETNLS